MNHDCESPEGVDFRTRWLVICAVNLFSLTYKALVNADQVKLDEVVPSNIREFQVWTTKDRVLRRLQATIFMYATQKTICWLSLLLCSAYGSGCASLSTSSSQLSQTSAAPIQLVSASDSGHVSLDAWNRTKDDPTEVHNISELSLKPVAAYGSRQKRSVSIFDQLWTDQKNYYSVNNLSLLMIGFAGGAVVANTDIDQDLFELINGEGELRSSGTVANILHSHKDIGDQIYAVPAFAAAWGAGKLFDDSPVGQWTGEWGERSFRSVLVGTPPMLLMQRVTGAGRPEEGDSHWQFWGDNNGVSGHSFIGAIPFLTAAQMSDDPLAKTLLYAGSTIVPISRVTDGAHYPSQALLGWWMAWSATMVVDATHDGDENWRMIPWIGPNGSGIGLQGRW